MPTGWGWNRSFTVSYRVEKATMTTESDRTIAATDDDTILIWCVGGCIKTTVIYPGACMYIFENNRKRERLDISISQQVKFISRTVTCRTWMCDNESVTSVRDDNQFEWKRKKLPGFDISFIQSIFPILFSYSIVLV